MTPRQRIAILEAAIADLEAKNERLSAELEALRRPEPLRHYSPHIPETCPACVANRRLRAERKPDWNPDDSTVDYSDMILATKIDEPRDK